MQELFGDQRAVVEQLRRLASRPNIPFHETLQGLAVELRTIDDRLRERLRIDSSVVLNAKKPDFAQAINGSSASFLNRFVAHRLSAIAAFEYLSGDLWNVERRRGTRGKSNGVTLVDAGSRVVRLEQCDQVVIRHGTYRETWLQRAGYRDCAQLEVIVRQQGRANRVEWDPGWWAKNADIGLLIRLHRPAATTSAVETPSGPGGVVVETAHADPSPREFVTPITEAVATTFVRTLAGLIRHAAPFDADSFRMTLHRVLPLGDALRLQQISEYAGTRPDDSLNQRRLSSEVDGSAMQVGTVGRIFDVNYLAIGLCVRSGRPLILKAEDPKGADLNVDMKSLAIDESDARVMNSTVRAILTVPFFGAVWQVGGRDMVNLVLYVDSDNQALFSENVINLVHAACSAFARHVDELCRHREGGFRAVDWDLSSAGEAGLNLGNESIQGLQTLIRDPGSYYNLVQEGGLASLDLKFTELDVVDLVSGAS